MKSNNLKLFFFINFTISVFIIISISGCIKQNKNNELKEIKGEYLGQQKPGVSPQIFAPALVIVYIRVLGSNLQELGRRTVPTSE